MPDRRDDGLHRRDRDVGFHYSLDDRFGVHDGQRLRVVNRRRGCRCGDVDRHRDRGLRHVLVYRLAGRMMGRRRIRRWGLRERPFVGRYVECRKATRLADVRHGAVALLGRTIGPL